MGALCFFTINRQREIVAMGDTVGVHDEKELEGLSPQQRKELKQEVLRQLQTSPEIRAIINKDPKILTRDSRINKILRRKVPPNFNKLKKK